MFAADFASGAVGAVFKASSAACTSLSLDMTAVGMYRGSISLSVLLSGAFDYAKLFCDSLRWSRSQLVSGGRLLGTAFLSG